MQPLLRMLAQRPELLLEHARAYAELLASQSGQAYAGWQRRAVLGAAALALIVLALGLAGVALMLVAMLPAAAEASRWVLVAVPLLPLLAGLACLAAARARAQADSFAALRDQLQADLAMLRESGAA